MSLGAETKVWKTSRERSGKSQNPSSDFNWFSDLARGLFFGDYLLAPPFCWTKFPKKVAKFETKFPKFSPKFAPKFAPNFSCFPAWQVEKSSPHISPDFPIGDFKFQIEVHIKFHQTLHKHSSAGSLAALTFWLRALRLPNTMAVSVLMSRTPQRVQKAQARSTEVQCAVVGRMAHGGCATAAQAPLRRAVPRVVLDLVSVRRRVNREVQTVNWEAGQEGAVETGVKRGLKKAHKPWIRGNNSAQTVNQGREVQTVN